MSDSSSKSNISESASELTVGQLVDRLQAQGLLSAGSSDVSLESAEDVSAKLLEQARADDARRNEIDKVVGLVGASPREIQIKFLRGLVESREDAAAFLDDPAGYSIEHGVLLEPKVVRAISDSVLYGERLPADLVKDIGVDGVKDIIDMRISPGNIAAWPAAVAAVAAAVSAAAAVVTAVTAVTRHHMRDILAMKGLGPNGVRIPGLKPMPGGGGLGPSPMPIPPNPLGPDNPVGPSVLGGSLGRIG